MQTTWVLVADGSRARIFELPDLKREMRELADFAHPEGRAHNRDLATDAQGRFYGKGDRTEAHSAPDRTAPVVHEHELFAKQLAEHLEKGRTENRYHRLVLIAPPAFLGLLRSNLSREAQKLVEKTLAKDIVKLDAKEIEQYVRAKE
jgi:protein required for attachment to host cells